MNKIYYTYVYLDENDIPIYVGKGKGRRYSIHLERFDHHPFTQKINSMMNKGVLPKIVFIAKNVSESLAFNIERLAISIWGRKDLGLGTLLNLTDGGEGHSGQIVSDATRKRLSQASKGIPKSEEHKKAMRDKVISDELKQKYKDAWVVRRQKEKELGISRAGWTKTEESKQKMRRPKTELEKQRMREGWAKKKELKNGNS